MPFGLKNAGSTFQRLMNRMFAEKLRDTMEVNIDDMLVNSKTAGQHIQHLSDAFKILDDYNMKLNPSKCSFGVRAGKFLGYLITKKGIKANPDQLRSVLNLTDPRNKKEVQKLTGRLAALTRFIPKASERFQPFFGALKKSKEFT